ncbi:MAG: DUF6411 family protein [Solirubrobacteraceae bacterium]
MLIAGVIVLCVLLFVLAILAPRLSRHPERASKRAFGLGGRGASKAPGKLGEWLAKPFHKSSKAAGKSADAGRDVRDKMPV